MSSPFCLSAYLSRAKSAKSAKFLGGGVMDIETIGKDVLDCAYAIHSHFGSGLLEKAYRVILATELRRLGHKVEEEKVCGFPTMVKITRICSDWICLLMTR